MANSYGIQEHIADLGVWIKADSILELFKIAVLAVSDLMIEGPRIGKIFWVPLDLEEKNYAELLVRLLNEVVYQLDGENFVTVALIINKLTSIFFKGWLNVIPRNLNYHFNKESIKAVTYYNARLSYFNKNFLAQLVIDV